MYRGGHGLIRVFPKEISSFTYMPDHLHRVHRYTGAKQEGMVIAVDREPSAFFYFDFPFLRMVLRLDKICSLS